MIPLDRRTDLYDSEDMDGNEFLRKLKKLGRKNGVVVRFDPKHGQGSHGRVYYWAAFTTLKDRKKEIQEGLLRAMCDNLGIDPRSL